MQNIINNFTNSSNLYKMKIKYLNSNNKIGGSTIYPRLTLAETKFVKAMVSNKIDHAFSKTLGINFKLTENNDGTISINRITKQGKETGKEIIVKIV